MAKVNNEERNAPQRENNEWGRAEFVRTCLGFAAGLAVLPSLAACSRKNTAAEREVGNNPTIIQDTLCEVFVETAPPSAAFVPPSSAKSGGAAKPVTGGGIQNEFTEGRLELYYGNNEWTLWENDKRDLRLFARLSPPDSSFVIIGHADCRGSPADNEKLGWNRASGVADLMAVIKKDALQEVVSYGKGLAHETTDRTLQARDRRVTVAANQGVITLGLTALPAEYYLIDQSASMNEKPDNKKSKWNEVQSFKFPADAKVFTFSSETRVSGTKLADEIARGRTPLFSSIERMLGRIEDGKRLVVLTDGEDTMGGENRINPIIVLAKRRNISISFVGVGLDRQYSTLLTKIQLETGGSHYIGVKNPR